jgi:sulfite reductase (NADPH) flavoprotein alpha-component
MLPEPKLKTLQELIESSSREELIWINGYLSGLVSGVPSNGHKGHNGHSTEKKETQVKKTTILYGTETGNSKKLALRFTHSMKQKGMTVSCKGMDQYRLHDLVSEDFVLLIISTQGEGEPPAPAKKFFDHIMQGGFRLESMQFAVLALGDSAYPLFCKAGEDLDLRLAELGARRTIPLFKCDVDFEEPARQWFETVTAHFDGIRKPDSIPSGSTAGRKAARKIYTGTLLTHINLNDRVSSKETYHIEIGSEEQIDYEAGDAIAIVPENKLPAVERILALTGIDPEKVIETSKHRDTIRSLLTRSLNICFLQGSIIKKYAALTGQEIPDTRMDLADLIHLYPLNYPGQFEEVFQMLPAIAPRLYSVSSSPRLYPNEVHLTVARHRFYVEEEYRIGLCSAFLGDLPAGTQISFYVHRNRAFKLPAGDKDIIMVGPGTGIAPFRSFLQERDASGASGRNWLFFGEQHFRQDFLYQVEIQQYLQTGVLSRLHLAFSRDQQEKLYVQQRMKEQAKELYAWLESGAYFYVSGTRDPMSIDVEKALLEIVSVQGGKSSEEAEAWLENLKKEGRYHKDVY